MAKYLDLDGLQAYDTKIKTFAESSADSKILAHNNASNAHTTALSMYVAKSEKGAASGVATLDSNQKIEISQLPDSIVGQVEYRGLWNAATNTPSLNPTPHAIQNGYYYICSLSGTQFGITFATGDWIIANGETWGKVANSDAVTTVAGKTGNVVLVKADVGLGNVDNTSDVNKPVSTAQQAAIDSKVNTAIQAAIQNTWNGEY